MQLDFSNQDKLTLFWPHHTHYSTRGAQVKVVWMKCSLWKLDWTTEKSNFSCFLAARADRWRWSFGFLDKFFGHFPGLLCINQMPKLGSTNSRDTSRSLVPKATKTSWAKPNSCTGLLHPWSRKSIARTQAMKSFFSFIFATRAPALSLLIRNPGKWLLTQPACMTETTSDCCF